MSKTFVRQNLTESQSDSKLNEMIKAFQETEKRKNDFNQFCEPVFSNEQSIARLKTEKDIKNLPKNAQDAISKLSNSKFEESKSYIEKYLEYCKTPNESTRLDLAKSKIEKELKSCTVATHTWVQTFKEEKIGALSEGKSTSRWVSREGPKGSCGVVVLDRFEPASNRKEGATVGGWRLVVQEKVTRPAENGFLGQACSNLDEKPYVFESSFDSIEFNCKTISFSPL